jgi:hypothetical protein
MRKFLTFSRRDPDVSVAHALQNGLLEPHGAFEVRSGQDPIVVLPQDPRFVFIESRDGTVIHYDRETFAMRPFTLGLPILLLGPEIDAAAKGRAIITVRVDPLLDGHPKRDRIVYDTFAAAYFGTPGSIDFDDVRARKTLYLEVNRKRLINVLLRALAMTAAHEGVNLGELLNGIALDPRPLQHARNYAEADRLHEAHMAEVMAGYDPRTRRSADQVLRDLAREAA